VPEILSLGLQIRTNGKIHSFQMPEKHNYLIFRCSRNIYYVCCVEVNMNTGYLPLAGICDPSP
jgi:hypothetical protein